MSGSNTGAAPSGDDRAFVPENLSNTPAPGQVDDELTLMAFTLRRGAAGLAVYAAVRNDRDTPVCEAGMNTEFFDASGQSIASVTSVLESAQFYRTSRGAVIRCVGPGQIAMAGAAQLPSEVVLDQIGSLQHAFPAFTVDDIVAVDALRVSDVMPITTGVGTLFEGTLQNALEVSASAPRVVIFPVNRVGRPLGMATASAATDLAPGSSWSFETSNVDAAGADYAAYPAATFAP